MKDSKCRFIEEYANFQIRQYKKDAKLYDYDAERNAFFEEAVKNSKHINQIFLVCLNVGTIFKSISKMSDILPFDEIFLNFSKSFKNSSELILIG